MILENVLLKLTEFIENLIKNRDKKEGILVLYGLSNFPNCVNDIALSSGSDVSNNNTLDEDDEDWEGDEDDEDYSDENLGILSGK